MPVNTEHLQYTKYSARWKKCRDFVEGQETVKEEKQTYLPKPTGQEIEEYDAYVERASYYNATGRTKEILLGLVFIKEPVFTVPTTMEDYLKNVTSTGQSLRTFAHEIMEEMLITSRGGVLVDYPQAVKIEGKPITRAQAEAMNIQPYMSFYQAESIINWKTIVVNNEEILEFVVLSEIEYVADPKDPFKIEAKVVYRVLTIQSGIYQQEIYREKDKGGGFEISEIITPKIKNKNMTRIPFVFFNTTSTDWNITKPFMLDLVNINLAHYRTSADNEHALHYTALPTAVITGYKKKQGDAPFQIGSAVVWTFAEPQATAFFLEFQGLGLEPMQRSIDSKENQMSKLGAKMLGGDKKAAEAAETAKINRAGEASSLSDLTKIVNEVLEMALEFAAEWMSVTGEISVELNNDYMPIEMSADDLNALMDAWQGGGMTYETFYHNLQKGEFTRPGITAEQEKDQIEVEGPREIIPDEGADFGS